MTDKKPKLTPKQAKFVKGIAEGKTNTESALEAYDTDDYGVAASIATENLKKPEIQQAVQMSMEKQGITVDAVVKPIVDGLTAYKTGFSKDGDFVEFGPDHSTRLKASSMALDLMGAKQKSKESGNTINNFGQILVDQRDKYAD
jgi:hypothetical protein